ncbi:MAG: heme iron utilization protein [Rhodospirillaceae bacterium]|nr:heme iron utilization protein [Rhodospirillaceae bacterium]
MSEPCEVKLDITARQLIRKSDRAVLSTIQCDGNGWPYGSLVLTACDPDATPLLLISDLALHTRNLQADGRVSLLFEDTGGLEDPLIGARVTVIGHAVAIECATSRARYLARHPSANQYADFTDFNLYRVTIDRAHVVAGFGRIGWVEGRTVRYTSKQALTEAERSIVAHMNADHADALDAYARELCGLEGKGWRMTGCDGEGVDLRLGGDIARIWFDAPVQNVAGARRELVSLARRARGDTVHK